MSFNRIRLALLVETFLMIMRNQTTFLMKPIKARIRHRLTGKATLTLASPHAFITPGQSCVLYKGDRILGGGIIENQTISLN